MILYRTSARTLGAALDTYVINDVGMSKYLVFCYVVQLLHKLSIHADDGPMKLMKVYTVYYNR